MSRYLPLTSATTFLCEHCHRRFPASQLYGKWPRKRDLARGIAHAAHPPYVIHRMVCSFACEQVAPRRTLADLHAALAWEPASVMRHPPPPRPVSRCALLAEEITARLARGERQKDICAALDIPRSTLSHWLRMQRKDLQQAS